MIRISCNKYNQALTDITDQMESAAWRLLVLERDIALGDTTNINEYRELSLLLFGEIRQDRKPE